MSTLLPFLDYLPNLHFCETDPAVIEQGLFAIHEKVTGQSLSPGNPERLVLSTVAAVLAAQRVIVDEAARGQLLAFAAGAQLDHIGAPLYCQRLPASAAVATLRVDLAGAQGVTWTAPAGTRVSPDGKLFFTTDGLLSIPPGQTSGQVGITCATTGEVGNGYLPGQVAKLVDPLPFVASVANVDATSGGAEVEDDERYRERIHLAPAQFSVAGPEDAYRYWVMSAHQTISDVAVVSPSPVLVDLYPLLEGGGIPGPALLDLVRRTVDSKARVPLTDVVSVQAPEVVEYDLRLTWWLEQGRESAQGLVAEAVDNAVAAYVAWQRASLKRDVTPSELVRLVKSAGVKRVTVESPVDVALERWQVAHAGEIVVAFGGLE